MSGLSVYRKIWTNANGPIPVDSDGRTFHIHHVDGNRDNNELSNLRCLSIMDHYRLYERQCEWCGNSGKGGFWYNHGDYCQQNSNNNRVTCEYCNANSHPRIHMRYHGDNCKKNKS